MSATYEVRGDVAVISLNNPPVNGLGYDTRRGIAEGLERAAAESGVRAIVITGAGKAFSGGADIREFGSPKAVAEPSLPNLILAIEGSAKPVVAALHSVAMGGGLELALGCHFRVADKAAKLGLPERVVQHYLWNFRYHLEAPDRLGLKEFAAKAVPGHAPLCFGQRPGEG